MAKKLTEKQIHRQLIKKAARYVVDMDLQGCFIECGVKQGTSSAIMASVMQRKGYLFDTWKGFPGYTEQDVPNSNILKRVRKRVKQSRTTNRDMEAECLQNLRDNKVLEFCTLVKGDICKTMPEFYSDHTDINVCMMHLDTDVCEPIKISLECMWNRVVDGGLVVIHDYGSEFWPGVKEVVDEFSSSTSDCYIKDMKSIGICAATLSKGKLDKGIF